jgi:hypothetical protein
MASVETTADLTRSWTMPVYHFNVVGARKLLNPRGGDLPGDEAARHYGQRLTDGLKPVALARQGFIPAFVEVVDETGNTLARCEVVPQRSS